MSQDGQKSWSGSFQTFKYRLLSFWGYFPHSSMKLYLHFSEGKFHWSTFCSSGSPVLIAFDLAWYTISKSDTSRGVQHNTSKIKKINNKFVSCKNYISKCTGIWIFFKNPGIAHIHIALCGTGKFIFYFWIFSHYIGYPIISRDRAQSIKFILKLGIDYFRGIKCGT